MPEVEKREFLESWKEISAYLNRDVKTCRRWEQTLGLPIRRLDGTPRARVFAYKDEIDLWLEDKLNNREITTTKYLRIAKKKSKRLWVVMSAGLAFLAIAAITLRLIPSGKAIPPGLGKPHLAVLPVKNYTGDDSLGDLRKIMTNIFVTDLCQSKYIKVLPEVRMNTILEDLDRFQADSYTTKDLKKIASRENITHFLDVSVNKFGDLIRVTLSVLEAGTWKTTWTTHQDGPSDGLLPMVDDLTTALKPHLNLTNAQITADFDEKIENVTSPNMQALKFYFDAKEAFNKTEWNLAIDLYKRAIALDPDFAMAYRMLSGVYNHLGLQFQQQIYWDNLRKFNMLALEAARRRPPSARELLIIEGTNQIQEGTDRGDVAAEMEIFKKLLEYYPEDDYGNYRLGVRYVQGYNYQRAEELLKRIVNYTESWTTYKWLGDVYLDEGRYEEAEDLFESGMERFPNNWFFYDWMIRLHILKREFPKALLWCERGLETEPIQFRDSLARGDVLFFSGDFQGAEQEYRLGLESQNNRTRIKAGIGLVHLYKTQGRFQDVLTQAEKTKQALVEDRSVDFDPIHRELALLSAKTGNIQAALKLCDDVKHPPYRARLQAEVLAFAQQWRETEQLLEELEQGLQKSSQSDWNMYLLKNGCEGLYRKQVRYDIFSLKIRMALGKGRYLDVLAEVEEAKAIFPGINSIPADLTDLSGTAHFRMGDWESARKDYESITRMTYTRQEFGDIFAKSYYMLGKIYELLGKKREAGRNYGRFLELWKNADPGIPEVDDARALLAALQ